MKQRQRLEEALTGPRDTRGLGSHQTVRGAPGRFHHSRSEGTNPSHTLTLDSRPPELWENTFLFCFVLFY